jgi:prepilin-type N-terminal cleavage/methylation domain-containing protein
MKKNMKNQKGFSLIELLVVVIIIGIIAAIAIPSLLASRRAATEAAAVSALRTIMSANATYQATTGAGVNYGSLGDLNTSGGLIDAVLATGTKGGYGFVMTGPADGTPAPGFCVVATPTDTNLRTYAMGYDGVIKTNVGNVATGVAPACTATFTTSGAVLGN